MALTFLGTLNGCTTDDLPPPVGTTDNPIVNGQVDNGHPGVVALTAQGDTFCTGTLITPTVVLTAAHCLPPNIPGNYQGIDIFFGTVEGNGQYVNVIEGWTNPAWHDQALYDDIGLVRLQNAAPAQPIPMNTGSLSQGQQTTLVGFGVTSGNGSDSGVKRVGTAQIVQLDTFIIEMGPNPSSTCFGDSGGTTLIDINGTEHVAGVHSRADCAGSSIDMRVDAYMADIQAFIGVPPDCGADGLCADNCAAPDPDCPCAADGHCTDACTNSAADPDCDPNCVPNGICATNCPTPDVDCDCSANGECNPLCDEANPDPDCVPSECAQDGQCNASCDNDPDCWSSGDVEDEDYSGTTFSSGSCRAGAAGGEPAQAPGRHGMWWLLGLGLLLTRRRR